MMASQDGRSWHRRRSDTGRGLDVEHHLARTGRWLRDVGQHQRLVGGGEVPGSHAVTPPSSDAAIGAQWLAVAGFWSSIVMSRAVHGKPPAAKWGLPTVPWSRGPDYPAPHNAGSPSSCRQEQPICRCSTCRLHRGSAHPREPSAPLFVARGRGSSRHHRRRRAAHRSWSPSMTITPPRPGASSAQVHTHSSWSPMARPRSKMSPSTATQFPQGRLTTGLVSHAGGVEGDARARPSRACQMLPTA